LGTQYLTRIALAAVDGGESEGTGIDPGVKATRDRIIRTLSQPLRWLASMFKPPGFGPDCEVESRIVLPLAKKSLKRQEAL
jgi:hypothetical protein